MLNKTFYLRKDLKETPNIIAIKIMSVTKHIKIMSVTKHIKIMSVTKHIKIMSVTKHIKIMSVTKHIKIMSVTKHIKIMSVTKHIKIMSVTKHIKINLENCETTYLNHVLVCGFHAKDENNVNLFEEYKREFILRNQAKLESFSKEILYFLAC